MYRFDFTAGAERELDHLDSPTRTRILKRLKWLGENADVIQHEELTGPLSDLFKTISTSRKGSVVATLVAFWRHD